MKRRRIFERDGFRCVYCGNVYPPEQLTLDHVQARVHGGDRSDGNLVTACGGCNVKKGHRKVAEFLRDDVGARGNFFRYAVHVWERHVRAIREEMERPPGRRVPEEG